MSWWKGAKARLWTALRPGAAESRMEEEFRDHLEREIEKNLRAGLAPAEARRRAAVAFGGIERHKEGMRDGRGRRWLEDLGGDLRYAIRQLLRNPGFAAVAIVTLSLGIGANSAIFTAVNVVLLEPLEYHEPDRLFFIYSKVPAWGEERYGLSPSEYRELQELAQSFSEIGAWRVGSMNLSLGGNPARVTAATASSELFETLGVPAHIGRVFTREEDAEGGRQVAVVSHALWRTAFASDAGILGRRIEVDGEPRTIVGVMPKDFDIEDAEVDLWLPAAVPENPSMRGAHFLSVVGRLAPGVTAEWARAEMEALLRSWGELRPSWHAPNDSTHRLGIVDLREHMVGDVRGMMLILLGAVGFVLLIACANVANLLLARAEVRRKEIAVRAAIGAGRWRLARQFLTESAVLASIGGAVGLFLGHHALSALLATGPNTLPRIDSLQLDATVLLFTLVITVLTSIVFGFAPLSRLRRGTAADLKAADARSTVGSNRLEVRRLLVISQVALAVVLLIGSGLLLRSLGALYDVDPGFEIDGLLTFELSLPSAAYPEGEDRASFFSRLISSLEAIPGVGSATAMSGLPPVRRSNETEVVFEGKEEQPGSPNHSVDHFQFVAGDYFATMDTRIVAGRAFDEGDDAGAAPVAIINQTLARTFYAGENPVGQRLRANWDNVPWATIVGIAEDVKQGGLAAETGSEVYFHYPQGELVYFAPRTMHIVARSVGPSPLSLAGEARSAVHALDPSLPLAQLQTMEAHVARSLTLQRFLTLLLGIFAGVGLALAAIGTYGVLSYSVAARVREIGIRIALGAHAGGVLRMVLRDGLALTALGLVLGLVGALALTRLLSSLLFGISSTDPLTFVAAVALLGVVALIACFIPAWRATHLDPTVALRTE